MTTTFDFPAVVASRQAVAAGLAVRLVDHATRCAPGRRGGLFVVTVPAGDTAGIAARVTAERPDAAVEVIASPSPTQCLRRLARSLHADHTGNQTYLTRQIHAALNDRQSYAVAVVAGGPPVRPCYAAMEQLAGHPRLIVAILTDRGTASRFNRYAAARPPLTFHADTIAERERLGRLILRLGRFKRRRERA